MDTKKTIVNVSDNEYNNKSQSQPIIEPVVETEHEESITLTIEYLNYKPVGLQEALRQQQLRQQMLPPRRRVDPRFRLF